MTGTSTQPWRPALVLAATIFASAMVFIDSAVSTVANPAIQDAFGASLADMQRVANTYTVVLAALVLVGGAAGDAFGRRRMFLLGLVGFSCASLACAAAGSIDRLILFQAAKGAAAALMVPGSLAIIGAEFAARDRGRAIGLWAGLSSLATAIGPVLGGSLVDQVSWRAVYLIAPALGLLVIALTLGAVAESRDREAPGRLDWRGAVLAVAALGLLNRGLIAFAEQQGITRALVLVAGALAFSLALLWWERRAVRPMLPIGLFADRTFASANLMTLVLYVAVGGVVFFLPFHLIEAQAYRAVEAGAAFLPFTIMVASLSGPAGAVADRLGPRLPLTVGPLVTAGGLVLLALPGLDSVYWRDVMPAIVLIGLGMAITIAPLSTAVMNSVDADHVGLASGFNNAVSRVASVLGIASLGIVAVAAFDASVAESGLAGAEPALRFGAGGGAHPDSYREAMLAAFRAVMALAAAAAVLSGLLAFLNIGKKLKAAAGPAGGGASKG